MSKAPTGRKRPAAKKSTGAKKVGKKGRRSESHTRAKAKKPGVRECINVIVGMMERLEWKRGKSARELAELWGVSVSTIENYSAEASRMVTADADEARRDITAGCRKLFREAVETSDHKGARAVGELWANVSGAKAAEKHELSGALGIGEPTPKDAARAIREHFGSHALNDVEDHSGDTSSGATEGVSGDAAGD